MSISFAPDFDDLPEQLAIFPLDGVVLLPKGDLPLNIFESRYIAMIDDALKSSRMIGIVQPYGDIPSIFKTGCAGRITQFSETGDGRYLVTLTGICRFHILKELPLHENGFRTARIAWGAFRDDMSPACLDLDRAALIDLLGEYLDQHGISLDWSLLNTVSDEHLMTTLAMVCPFSASEKQALLEAPCCVSRANLFLSLLELSVRHGGPSCSSH
ncbi:MAG TPA: LON peptidase substrate-binding domain-containing protein [Alphaproteobacteria bacterium]|nr:LON peptidase substrate-binding domain-containing protein [Alphaproteobacteria bacterium]HNS43770.1 LON peptidase substrate-binding domain-containing protein [Alphaproteobacteria bacterium]